MSGTVPVVAIFGASGLIGEGVARHLAAGGCDIVPVARRFSSTQRHAYGASAIEAPFMDLSAEMLGGLIGGQRISIIVNCVGVLQDGARGTTKDVHQAFVGRLLELLARLGGGAMLVQISIPGDAVGDQTAFSRTKRAAEQMIQSSAVPYVILRPGFVVAPVAYGGGALLRALAALPAGLSAHAGAQPFAITAMADIGATIAQLAARWQNGERGHRAVWDVMDSRGLTLGAVLEALRDHFGGPRRRLALPDWLLTLAAGAGDFASLLGWSPPVRTTALLEMRRGVTGDPRSWTAETGLRPSSLSSALAAVPSSVQERWFARLFLLKPMILGTLVVFWAVSGLIALTVAFTAAESILRAHGFAPPLAIAVTVISSLADIAVGIAIACKRSCRLGLLGGISLSLSYMAGAAVLTPEMWIEPLGALVKTGPAIVLMLVGLAVFDDR